MKNIHFKDIPNSLQKYRRARGFKQKEVAEILKLKSSSQISRWERVISLPSSLNTFRLAALYRTAVDPLFIDLLRLLKNDMQKREQKILNAKTKNDNQCSQNNVFGEKKFY